MPMQSTPQTCEYLPPKQEFSFCDERGIAKRFDPTKAKLVDSISDPSRHWFTYVMESGDWFLLEYNHFDGLRMLWKMVTELRLDTTLPLGRILTAEQAIDWYIRSNLELPDGLDGRHRTVPSIETITAPAVSESTDYSIPTGPDQSCSRAKHTKDFRSVHWYGKDYVFTENQAIVVRELWIAWKGGTPAVGKETLLNCIDPEAPPPRVDVVFRDHPAWKKMIVPGVSKGTYKLEPSA